MSRLTSQCSTDGWELVQIWRRRIIRGNLREGKYSYLGSLRLESGLSDVGDWISACSLLILLVHWVGTSRLQVFLRRIYEIWNMGVSAVSMNDLDHLE